MDSDLYGVLADEARRSDDVLLVRRARELGLTEWGRRELVRAGAGYQLPRGVVAVPPVRDAFRSRARAAQLLIPRGVLSGRTAARLWRLQGLPELREDEALELVLPRRSTRWQRAGLRLHWSDLPASAVIRRDGLRVTAVERTLRDLQISGLPLRRFVCVADSAVQQRLLTQQRVVELAGEVAAGRAAAWRLVDGRSESPSETVVRLVLHDGGLPAPDLQIQVRDRTGRIIARLDMGWRRQRVGLEVDSRHHDEPSALYRDRYRQNTLAELGWTVVRVTAYDAWSRPANLCATVRGVLDVSDRRSA